MEKTVKLGYGTDSVEIEIKNAKEIREILPNAMPELADPEQALITALETGAINSKPLKACIGAEDPVTIVISDVTRCWMHQDRVVELLVDYLHGQMGLKYEQICILIALGTHRHTFPEEIARICGERVPRLVKVVDHDCDADDLVTVGVTSRGTHVTVNPLLIDRKVIVIGGTVHHMMAGFGGGRKNILPGCSSRSTIRENHERALDPQRPMTDERVGCCLLNNNPIHEDMAEAASLIKVAFGINIVVAASGKYSGFFCGDMDAAWKASCDYVADCYEVEVPESELADVVICSSGGYPKDMNLYQGCKGMLNAMRALKPGGEMLWLCKCPEGGGAPDYFSWLKPLAEGRLDPALRADFTIGGYIFYLTIEQINKAAHVYTLTELDPSMIAPMGIEASKELEELLSKLDFAGKKVSVLPYAGSLVPVRKK